MNQNEHANKDPGHFESNFGIDSDRDYRSGLNNTVIPAAETDVLVAAPKDLPLHPLTEPPEPQDSGVARQNLEPTESPAPPRSLDPSAIHELGDFAKFVAAMCEKDYGDWMRRANVYWENLRDNLLRSCGQVEHDYILNQLAALKKEIQYNPSWKILETQRRVVTKALEMRRRFGAKDELSIHDLQVSTSTETPAEGLH